MTLAYSLSDLAGVSLTGAVVAVWAAVAGGSFSVRALSVCEAAFLAFYLVGSLFAAWGRLAAGALFDLPLRLLMGYAAVNTALLVLAWLSPLGIVANFGVVVLVGSRPRCWSPRDRSGKAARGFRRSPGRRPVIGRCHALVPGLAPPDVCRREHLAFKPWIDGFYTRSTFESSVPRTARPPSRTSGWPACPPASTTMAPT